MIPKEAIRVDAPGLLPEGGMRITLRGKDGCTVLMMTATSVFGMPAPNSTRPGRPLSESEAEMTIFAWLRSWGA
jgi:hypothetical protein